VEGATIYKYREKFEGEKGPKMKIPDTFTGDRTDTTGSYDNVKCIS